MIKKFLFILLIALSLSPVLVLAADPFAQVQQIGENINLPSKVVNSAATPQSIIVSSIRYLLTFIGLVLVVSILYAGFQWMTSGGEEEKITKAKDRLKYSILGLMIILAGYSIVLLVNRIINEPTVINRVTTCDPRGPEKGDKECRDRFGDGWYCLANDNAKGSCLFDATKKRNNWEDVKDRLNP